MLDLSRIRQLAEDFIAATPLNQIDELNGLRLFDKPIIKVADAADPLFDKLKSPAVIGEHYLLPAEWLPEARSVLSILLPFTEEVRKSNYTGTHPSIEWLYGRIEGQCLVLETSRYLRDEIMKAGVKAVVPAADPRFVLINRCSNWSERHAAFIAGQGTFGLNKSLISSRGTAARYGSVITSLNLEPDLRDYQDIYEYCTLCGSCIPRCPSGAITKEGKNIPPCADYLDEMGKIYHPRYACGKCQTSVPCEYSRP
ncbi:MAG: 4Fe-4S binding protein [Clostridia bacterium]|nr:4Fe-4S binding protein [Clostridia bacterium]